MAERQKQELWLCVSNKSHPQGYCDEERQHSPTFISFLCSFTLLMALHSLSEESFSKGFLPALHWKQPHFRDESSSRRNLDSNQIQILCGFCSK